MDAKYLKIKLKMPDSTFQAWLAALRSGLYQQCQVHMGETMTMNGHSCHCAMGVLCEVMNTPKAIGADGVLYYGTIAEEKTTCHPPLSVQEATGLSRIGELRCSVRMGNAVVWSITGLNDNGMPFPAIADIIEAQFQPTDDAATTV